MFSRSGVLLVLLQCCRLQLALSFTKNAPLTTCSRRERLLHVAAHPKVTFLKSTDSANTNTKISSSSSATTSPVASFVSPKFQVYIEDTDAYGVLYNANYIRSYDRALHSMYALQDSVTASSHQEEKPASMLDRHEDWAIVQVQDQKFKSSPKLGGMYCVHGALVEHEEDKEIWDLTMQENEDNKNSTIYNSARLTIAHPGVYAKPKKVLLSDDDEKNAAAKEMTTHKDLFRLFRDEFDVHFPTHIPLRNVLNLFERSRSNFLGGPDSLRKLQEEHRLLFVVTKVDDLCKFPCVEDGDVGAGSYLKAGQLVLVHTDFEVKRKGMIMEFYHTLKANNVPIAQATVSLMTLDADTFKPTSNLPDWLWEILREG